MRTMKQALLPGAALAIALLCGLPTPQAATAASTTSSVTVFDSTEEFIKKMRQALEIGAHDEIAKLVRSQTDDAVAAAIHLCDANSLNPSERLENEIDALRIAWSTAKKTRFVEEVYEYYSLLDMASRKDRITLVNRYNGALTKLINAEAADDVDKIMGLAADFLDIARGIEAVGDHYYAGQAWLCYGRTQDEHLRGDDANLDIAADAYAKVVEHREAIELNDRSAEESRARLLTLTGMGYGPDAKKAEEGDGGGDGGPGKSAGDALTVDFTFELMQSPNALLRPNWACDVAYNSWSSIYLEDIGSTLVMPGLKTAKVVRTGIQTFEIVSGGVTSPATMNGKFVPIEASVETPSGQLPWGFIGITGTKEDYYQGVEVNREATPEGSTVFVSPAASIRGEIAGIEVAIFDDTMSGVYGDEPMSWAHVGMTPENYQWDMDAIQIDNGKKALPWSRLQKIGDQWYDLKVTGHQVQASPVEIKTGKLKLKFGKGPKPTYVIVRGMDKLFECYYDLTSSKEVEVPVGRYELFTGFIAEGKRTSVKKAVMLPGADTPRWKVDSDKTVEVPLGGPFGFDFGWEDEEDTVKILGATVCVTGISGERYERPWNARPYTMISIRKAGSKKGSKPEKMKSNLDVNTLYSDWGLGWHPQDLVLPKGKASGEEYELQMTEKKNALFGKVESKWHGTAD